MCWQKENREIWNSISHFRFIVEFNQAKSEWESFISAAAAVMRMGKRILFIIESTTSKKIRFLFSVRSCSTLASPPHHISSFSLHVIRRWRLISFMVCWLVVSLPRSVSRRRCRRRRWVQCFCFAANEHDAIGTNGGDSDDGKKNKQQQQQRGSSWKCFQFYFFLLLLSRCYFSLWSVWYRCRYRVDNNFLKETNKFLRFVRLRSFIKSQFQVFSILAVSLLPFLLSLLHARRRRHTESKLQIAQFWTPTRLVSFLFLRWSELLVCRI